MSTIENTTSYQLGFSRRDILRGATLGVSALAINAAVPPAFLDAKSVTSTTPSQASTQPVVEPITVVDWREKWQNQGLSILGPEDSFPADPDFAQALRLPEGTMIEPIEMPHEVAEVIDEVLSDLPKVEGYVQRIIPLINGMINPAYGQPNPDVGPNFFKGLFSFDINEGEMTQDLYLWLPPDLLTGGIQLSEILPDSRYSPLAGGELSEGLTYRDMLKMTIHHEMFHSYMYSLMARETLYDRDLFYQVMGSNGTSNREGNPLMRAYFDTMGYVLFDENRFGDLLNQNSLIQRADLSYRVSRENGIEIISNHSEDDWVLSHPLGCFGDLRIASFQNISRDEWRQRSPAVVFSLPYEAVANGYSAWKHSTQYASNDDGAFFTRMEQYLRSGFPDDFFMDKDVVREKFTPKVSEAVLKWRASHNSDK